MKTNTTVSTKVTKDAEAPIKTNLTIDWDGCTEDEVRAMAQAALIVKWQGQARTNGIPTEAEVKAVDFRVGTRAPRKVLTPAELVANLSPAEKVDLLARLQASLA